LGSHDAHKSVIFEEPPPKEPPKPIAKRATGNINVDQEMLKLRRIFITGDINDDSAKVIVQQLLFLEADDPTAPVTIFINSGGGMVHSGFAIVDMMTQVRLKLPLKTVAYGRCFSIAALLLSAGSPGHRSAYENTRLMIHEPSCSYPKMQASDIFIKVEELRTQQGMLERILSERTGHTAAEIAATARDRYMSASEAKEFGLIDNIVPVTKQEAPKTLLPTAVVESQGLSTSDTKGQAQQESSISNPESQKVASPSPDAQRET